MGIHAPAEGGSCEGCRRPFGIPTPALRDTLSWRPAGETGSSHELLREVTAFWGAPRSTGSFLRCYRTGQRERPRGRRDSQEKRTRGNICVRGAATAAAAPVAAPRGSVWFGDNPGSYGNTWATSGETGNGGKGCPSNGVSLRRVPRWESHGIGSSPARGIQKYEAKATDGWAGFNGGGYD